MVKEEMTIGENIRNIRKEKGLTQKQLGERCQINEVQIRQYELGKANPKIETVQKIAAALEVDSYSLYSFDVAPEFSSEEIKHIKKYRTLDPHGKKVVNFILDEEYTRQLTEQSRINAFHDSGILLNAAHERTDIPVTEEMRQADDDIMNDENF